MKVNGSGAKSFNVRGAAVTLGAGALLIFVAAQLLAKGTDTTPAAKPVAPGSTAATAGDTTIRVKTASGKTVTLPASNAKTAPAHAQAAEPPLRELFRPLVTKEAPKPLTPNLALAPKLPAVKPLPPVKLPTTAAATSITPAFPVGPSSRDIQMLGVVESSDGPKALLKNTSTGERRYFAKGEDVYGFKLDEIKGDSVTLSRNGRPENVAMASLIPIEGQGLTSVATTTGSPFSRSPFGSGAPGDFGSRRGDRTDRGSSRGNRDPNGGGGGGNAEPANPTTMALADILKLATWKEKLSKLEAAKASIDPSKYDGLHKFFAEKAAAEGK